MGSKVGELIKKKRKELHITQVQLSKMSGVSQSAISDIESANVTKLPNIDTIQKIANALCVSVS